MVQEATVICIDNSEWMRNGDYSPTRFQAQAEAVNLICGAKTQSNPENTVGILTMAGKGVRVLVNLTTDLGKILACMHGLEVGGEMNLTSGVQVAQLALKHRQNKHQRQRIIVFAGSPIASDKKTLESIGKRLKKNNVALDIVDFGEEEGGKAEKLDALLTSVNSNDNSHIVHVEPGPNILSDVLISTPIFTGDGEGGSGFAAAAAAGAAAAAAAAGGGGAFEFGVDPNLDPELALALRVSMEEERARQEAAARRAAEDSSTKAAPCEGSGTAADVRMTEASSGGGAPDRAPDLMDDDTALLEQALNMSMAEAGSGLTTAGPVPSGDLPMLDASVEDPDLAMALRLSMEEEAEPSQVSQVLGDRGFMSSILATLPGVDPNDPSVRDVLASLQQQGEDPKKDESGNNNNSNK